jgi:hypothetical protein
MYLINNDFPPYLKKTSNEWKTIQYQLLIKKDGADGQSTLTQISLQCATPMQLYNDNAAGVFSKTHRQRENS